VVRIFYVGAFVCALLFAPAATAQAQNSDRLNRQPPPDATNAGEKMQDEKRKRAAQIIRQMSAPQSVVAMESTAPPVGFGGEFARLAYENAYVSLWARPGLSPRDRSILTIGILIGIGNETELGAHVSGALKNGVTRQELEEIIYHATAYAGFPAASSALSVARKAVDPQQGK
jgi:4-carboxymuconolactone decarboxylase